MSKALVACFSAGAVIREGILVHSKKDEAFWTDWAQKNP